MRIKNLNYSIFYTNHKKNWISDYIIFWTDASWYKFVVPTEYKRISTVSKQKISSFDGCIFIVRYWFNYFRMMPIISILLTTTKVINKKNVWKWNYKNYKFFFFKLVKLDFFSWKDRINHVSLHWGLPRNRCAAEQPVMHIFLHWSTFSYMLCYVILVIVYDRSALATKTLKYVVDKLLISIEFSILLFFIFHWFKSHDIIFFFTYLVQRNSHKWRPWCINAHIPAIHDVKRNNNTETYYCNSKSPISFSFTKNHRIKKKCFFFSFSTFPPIYWTR